MELVAAAIALCMACQGWGLWRRTDGQLLHRHETTVQQLETEREYAIRVLREEMR